MPYANPSRSFEVAVRHLFRHLRDSSALRRNPIVRQAFAYPAGQLLRDVATLAAIRSAIVDAARDCFEADIREDRRSEGEQQFAIVTALCSGQSCAEIAADLAISKTQLYRDRAIICSRVARILQSRTNAVIASAFVYDPLRFALRRISSLIDHGYAQKAAIECERMLPDTSSDAHKVLVLLLQGDASRELGDLNRAVASLQAARRLMGETWPEEAVGEQQRLALLLEHDLALDLGIGNPAHSITSLAELGSLHDGTPERDTIELSVLIARLKFAGYTYNYRDARSILATVFARARNNTLLIPEQRVQVAFLSAYAHDDGALPLDQVCLRLGEALGLSRSLGSARGVLAISITLAIHCAALGNDDQAKSYLDCALLTARSMEGSQALLAVVSETAPAMMETRYWRVMEPLLAEIACHSRTGTSFDCNRRAALGALLVRRGNFSEAVETLTIANTSTSKRATSRTHGTVLRNLALALHGARRDDDARVCIRSAVDLLDAGAYIGARSLTYRAAYDILKDPRMLRLATAAMPNVRPNLD